MMRSSDAPRIEPPAFGRWENEGGSISPPDGTALPDGVTAYSVTHYRVGSYHYTNLTDAMAEHRRQARK